MNQREVNIKEKETDHSFDIKEKEMDHAFDLCAAIYIRV
jgi:hypothetical protein